MSTIRRPHQSGKLHLALTGIVLFLLLFLAAATTATADPNSPGGNGNGNGNDPKPRHHTVARAPVELPNPPTHSQQRPTNPGPPPRPPTPDAARTEALTEASAAPAATPTPVPGTSINLKLLVVSANSNRDGQEPDFNAIKAFLDQIGIPYDVLDASKTTLTASMLSDGALRAYYQGIILTTGALVTGQQESAFSSDEWTTLWLYEAKYRVRQVTSYTAPIPYPDSYGLKIVREMDTTNAPLQATLTSAGQTLFPYLNAANPITIKNAYAYLAQACGVNDAACSANPPPVTPLLTTSVNNVTYVIAATAKYTDGRENLAVTVANNPNLTHSMLLSYGIINWVTKGFFLGERHANLGLQVDDMLDEDDIWDTAALADTTGLTYRMTGADLTAFKNWQTTVRSKSNTSAFRVEWAFNGEGAAAGAYSPDTLTPVVKSNQANFNWISHTYSHLNLDAPTTAAQTQSDLTQNDTVARTQLRFTLNSNYFKDSMVQPDISGLNNSEALLGMKTFGIKYIIADTSQPGWNNPSPNAGVYSSSQPSILIIPRHPSNLFYNLKTPEQWVSEYNCYYGPNATCASGAWKYWDHNLTYAEILDKESDVLLSYLLKWDLDPLMFHQPNSAAYSGSKSLLSDLVDATLTKYNAMCKLPIRNLAQHNLGIQMANRMAYNASGVQGTLVTGTTVFGATQYTVQLKATNAATIPLTGISYGANKETYGGQTISYANVTPGATLTFYSTVKW
ncbi:MAG: hypothetical protein U0768_20700 [Anaerolineae bacterium]